MSELTIPVAVYMRVSSDDQRDRETIKTQRDAIDRWLMLNPQYRVYRYYEDDGISGTIPLALRPQGRMLLADANSARFQKVVVLRASRLGREEADLLGTYNLFTDVLGIELVGVAESLNDRTMFGFQSIMAGYVRRQLLSDSARGMDRAAREGRYTGGIVPLGYRVTGRKQTARLEPDDGLIWGHWTAAPLVHRIYHWLGVEGRSCRWIASELNLLGIQTAYQRDGRGVRKLATQGIWRAGRLRNLVVNPVYKGVLQYGRRRGKGSKRSDIIDASVPPLVTETLWDAAQRTLSANRLMAKNTPKVYLLRSVITCGCCGLHYCGAQGRPGLSWYRCNGQIVERGPVAGKCPGKAIRSDWLEPVVWTDIEAWLRNPGETLQSLQPADEQAALRATLEAERITLETALAGLADRRKRAIDLNVRGRIDDAELDTQLAEADGERKTLGARLSRLVVPAEDAGPALGPDLLAELRQRLDAGLTDLQRHEIVRLLVKRIVVDTAVGEDGRKRITLRIDYRFPDTGCGLDDRGTGSWPRPA